MQGSTTGMEKHEGHLKEHCAFDSFVCVFFFKWGVLRAELLESVYIMCVPT